MSFASDPATARIRKAIEHCGEFMTVEDWRQLEEYVRKQAYLSLRKRAVARGESFPSWEEWKL